MKDIFAIKKGYVYVAAYTNDYYYERYDSMLKYDSIAFYNSRKDIFSERPAVLATSPAVIKDKQIAMLKEMKYIFDKHKTNVRILISTVYDLKKLNEADLISLNYIFGNYVLYDF